eukprot:GEMP01021979.1.p1 GENE.GEMP01021979.1~~GEMP01021979.1.p1  ORF type:complete len:786 (+),score=146.06 GEMP01021979.1:88-2358(+)
MTPTTVTPTTVTPTTVIPPAHTVSSPTMSTMRPSTPDVTAKPATSTTDISLTASPATPSLSLESMSPSPAAPSPALAVSLESLCSQTDRAAWEDKGISVSNFECPTRARPARVGFTWDFADGAVPLMRVNNPTLSSREFSIELIFEIGGSVPLVDSGKFHVAVRNHSLDFDTWHVMPGASHNTMITHTLSYDIRPDGWHHAVLTFAQSEENLNFTKTIYLDAFDGHRKEERSGEGELSCKDGLNVTTCQDATIGPTKKGSAVLSLVYFKLYNEVLREDSVVEKYKDSKLRCNVMSSSLVSLLVRRQLVESDLTSPSSPVYQAVWSAINQTIEGHLGKDLEPYWELKTLHIRVDTMDSQDTRRRLQWRSNNIVIDYVSSVVARARRELVDFMTGIEYDEELLAELHKSFLEDDYMVESVKTSEPFIGPEVSPSRGERANESLVTFFAPTPIKTPTTTQPHDDTSTMTTSGPTHSRTTQPLMGDSTRFFIATVAVGVAGLLCIFALWWFCCKRIPTPSQYALHDLEESLGEKPTHQPSHAPPKEKGGVVCRNSYSNVFKEIVEQHEKPLVRLTSCERAKRSPATRTTRPSSEKQAQLRHRSSQHSEAYSERIPVGIADDKNVQNPRRWKRTLMSDTCTSYQSHASSDATTCLVTDQSLASVTSSTSGAGTAQTVLSIASVDEGVAVPSRMVRQALKDSKMQFDLSPYKREPRTAVLAHNHTHGSLDTDGCYLCEYMRQHGLQTNILHQCKQHSTMTSQ